MMVAALPLIDLVYRRGHFSFTDSQETAMYFFWFSLSLAFWAAQGLYARAFYAAGDTLTPMVACTLVTLASLAVYRALFHSLSVVGLAIASDIGIIANTVAAAVLLHRRKLVSIGELPWIELGKATLVAVFAGGLAWQVSRLIPLRGSRGADLESLGLSSITWAGAVAAGLWLLRSDLPQSLRRKKAVEPAPETVAEAKEELRP
jgi:putative peptidoglycan lipid II flippase